MACKPALWPRTPVDPPTRECIEYAAHVLCNTGAHRARGSTAGVTFATTEGLYALTWPEVAKTHLAAEYLVVGLATMRNPPTA